MKITQVNSRKIKAYEIKVGECFEMDNRLFMRIVDDEEYISTQGKNEYPVVCIALNKAEVTRIAGTADVQPVNAELHFSYK